MPQETSPWSTAASSWTPFAGLPGLAMPWSTTGFGLPALAPAYVPSPCMPTTQYGPSWTGATQQSLGAYPLQQFPTWPVQQVMQVPQASASMKSEVEPTMSPVPPPEPLGGWDQRTTPPPPPDEGDSMDNVNI